VLREDAYARLKQSLFDSALRPGQLVSQKELAKLIHCSLGPTREAIQRLAAESLLRDVFQLRAMIEREAAQAFVATAERAEILALKAEHQVLLRRTLAGVDRPMQAAALRLDWRFHDRVVAALDNGLVVEIYRVNSDRIRLIQAKRGYVVERLPSAMREHLAILNAGLRHGPLAAAEAMDRHLRESRRWAVRV
jgi:DNA-binding GntR family transcriptional regulator